MGWVSASVFFVGGYQVFRDDAPEICERREIKMHAPDVFLLFDSAEKYATQNNVELSEIKIDPRSNG